MLKKATSVFLACVFVLCLSVSAFAENNISPRYANINQADATLSVSSGTATVRATISGVSKVTKVTVYAYLQQYTGGTWKNVASWSQSANSTSTTLVKTASVSSGYTYRVQASCYAYVGSSSENATAYSGSVYY